MARKKKVSPVRIGWLVAILVLGALAVLAWQHRAQLRSALSLTHGEPAALTQASSADTKAPQDTLAVPVRVSGKLQIAKQPRDADLGVSADAVVLLRNVSIYQWQEHCEGGACKYETVWSDEHVDSHKFRTQAGHENPPAPFANARFVAADVRLDDLSIDPELVTAQHDAIDFPIAASALPPNLAATFSVVDGVLYAGGDAAHPRAGMLRIRYRIVPAGEVSLSGIRRGIKLTAR